MKTLIVLITLVFCFQFTDAQWQKTNCPYNGKVKCIATNATKIYVGTEGGGIYASSDNGLSWNTLNNGLGNLNVMAFAFNSTIMYAGTLGGVYISSDSGSNWALSNNGFAMPNIQIISMFVKDNNVYAGTWTNYGVYKTSNNGQNWSQTTLTQQVSCFAENNNAIFAGTKNNFVFKSTDNFATWTMVDKDLNSPYIRDLAVIGNTVYAGTDGDGVYSTIDNGAHWVKKDSGLTIPYIQSIEPVGLVLYAGTAGIFRTSNSGSSWKKCDHCMPAFTQIYSLMNIGSVLYAATEEGLWKNPISSMLDDIEICMVSVNDNNKNIIVWEKPVSAILDTIYVYRETNITGVYEIIGKVSKIEISEFIDITSKPDVNSNRYRLSYNSNCSEPLVYSASHKTMHLAINKGSGNNWNLIWDPYDGFKVATYNIYKGDNASNLSLIGSVSGITTQFTDVNPTSSSKYYQVEVVPQGACSPSKTYTSTRSNIVTSTAGGMLLKPNGMKAISIFPNPVNECFQITGIDENPYTGQLRILNIYNEVVYVANDLASGINISVKDFASGIYTIYYQSENNKYTTKIVVIH